jgi:hypothetical protein
MAGEMAREVVERGPLSEPYTAYAPDGVRLPFWCIDGIGKQQAEWAENMFTLLLSRRAVHDIPWYDRAWRPKPVYRRIERILAEAGKIPPRPS